MDTRQLSILNLLLHNHEPISAKEIGHLLGLSDRVVRYNLGPIKNWLIEYGIDLVNKPNFGIFLPVSINQRKNLLNKITTSFGKNVILQQKNRILLMEFELMNNVSPCTGNKLEYLFGISHNTCNNDLLLIEENLQKVSLKLIRTTGYGTEIVGPELKYRYRFIEIVNSIFTANDLIELCLWKKIDIERPFSEEGILKIQALEKIQKWELYDAWRMLRKLAQKLSFRFTDIELLFLTLYIAISIKRISSGHNLKSSTINIEDASHYHLYENLKSLLPSFNLFTYFVDNEAELAQLVMEIKGSKRNLSETETIIKEKNNMIPIAEEILEFASNELGFDLKIPKVVNMLAQHLNLSITRLEHELPLLNPILDDIVKNYSSTISIVEKVVNHITLLSEKNLPIEELGYIALYIEMAKIEAGIINKKERKKVLVVCPTAGITVVMLLLRLEKELPEVEVIEVMSIREFSKNIFSSKIDAVITTVPSLTHKKLKVICVTPLLDEEEKKLLIKELAI